MTPRGGVQEALGVWALKHTKSSPSHLLFQNHRKLGLKKLGHLISVRCLLTWKVGPDSKMKAFSKEWQSLWAIIIISMRVCLTFDLCDTHF